MQKKALLLLVISISLVFAACKKIKQEKACDQLVAAMQAADVTKAGEAIANYINTLPSKEYTEANLNKLMNAITTSKCGITASQLCFDCIKTLPSMSEFRISIQTGSTTLSKTIDISYLISDNRMRFVNMHE